MTLPFKSSASTRPAFGQSPASALYVCVVLAFAVFGGVLVAGGGLSEVPDPADDDLASLPLVLDEELARSEEPLTELSSAQTADSGLDVVVGQEGVSATKSDGSATSSIRLKPTGEKAPVTPFTLVPNELGPQKPNAPETAGSPAPILGAPPAWISQPTTTIAAEVPAKEVSSTTRPKKKTTTTSRPPTTPAPAPRPTTTAPPTIAPTPPAPTTAPPITAPPTTPTPPNTDAAQLIAPVRPEDIRLLLRPDNNAINQSWGSLQCDGSQRPSSGLPTQILGSAIPGPDQRFGVETVGGSEAFVLRANLNDGLFARANRCEMSMARPNVRIAHNSIVWQTFSIRTDDWTNSNDKQIIAQWHDGNNSVSKTPFMAFYMTGDQLKISLRYNAGPNVTNASSTKIDAYQGRLAPNSWDDFVIRARVSHDPNQQPFITIWRNGQKIVDYQGPFGYNQPGVTDYTKLGLYKWKAGNKWDAAAPTRSVWIRETALIFDPRVAYNFSDIADAVKFS